MIGKCGGQIGDGDGFDLADRGEVGGMFAVVGGGGVGVLPLVHVRCLLLMRWLGCMGRLELEWTWWYYRVRLAAKVESRLVGCRKQNGKWHARKWITSTTIFYNQ